MSLLSKESQESLHGSKDESVEHETTFDEHTLNGRMVRDIHLRETVFEILKEQLFQEAEELSISDECGVVIMVKHPTLDKWFEFTSEDMGILELNRKYGRVDDSDCASTNCPPDAWGNDHSKNRRRILKAKRLINSSKNSTKTMSNTNSAVELPTRDTRKQ